MINLPKPNLVFSDLGGPDGNVYMVIGRASTYARELHWSEDAVREMTGKLYHAESYHHVFSILETYFTLTFLEGDPRED